MQGTAMAVMKYCLRNMKLLRNEVSFGNEVKFATCAPAHFIAKLLHTPQGVLHLPKANFIEKSLMLCIRLFSWLPLLDLNQRPAD